MSQSEKSILNETLVEVSGLSGALVYRQNTGQGWQGKPVRVDVGDYVRVERGMKILREARPVNFGLEGAGDITGTIGGRAVQIEMKTATGRQRQAQQVFEAAWKRCGGIYVLARSKDETIRILRETLG